MLHNLPDGRPLLFTVGVPDVVPKSIAYRVLAPALQLPEPVRIVCREGDINALLAELSIHKVDLVLADGTIPPGINVRGFNYQLGDCGITFFVTPRLARKFGKNFPDNLNGAPMLMPGEMTMVRSRLVLWLDRLHVYPGIIDEFDDSALMKVFGRSGSGVFIAPTSIAEEVKKQYGVAGIGQTDEVSEQFYAISVERKISHPAVAAITDTAREWLFRDASIRS